MAPRTLVLMALLYPSLEAAAEDSNAASGAEDTSAAAPPADTSDAQPANSVEVGSQDGAQGTSGGSLDDASAAAAARDGSPAGPASEGPLLVGTAEISMAPSTRSTYLTLNPPKDCAYLCNMTVAPPFRRKGAAMEIVDAAEDIGRIGGESEMYLHLRFKDGAANKLYRKAGFSPRAQDSVLVKLLSMDQRYLMHKKL